MNTVFISKVKVPFEPNANVDKVTNLTIFYHFEKTMYLSSFIYHF